MSYSIVFQRPIDNCCVCLSTFSNDDDDNVVAHDAQHFIHQNCLLNHIEYSMGKEPGPSCPLCRRAISNISGVATNDLECTPSMVKWRHKALAKVLQALSSLGRLPFSPSSVVVERMLENKIRITKYLVRTPMGPFTVSLTPSRKPHYEVELRTAQPDLP